MEVGKLSSDVVAVERMMVSTFLEVVVVENLLAAQRSLACFLLAHQPLGFVLQCAALSLCAVRIDFLLYTLFTLQRGNVQSSGTGTLLSDVNVLPEFTGMDKRFPMDELHRRKQPGPENKDASDDDDDDDDEDDDEDEVDDAGDEDFSGEEGGDDDDDEEGDPEDGPPANGNGGNDDEDDEDEDGDEDDDGDEEDEEEEDEDEEEKPPAKKRK